MACCNSRLLGGQEIHHQLGNQLRLIVLHLVASIGHIVKLDVGEHFFQLPAERHRTLEHPELFKTCILVDTNTLAPGISKNETVIANPPLPRLSRESQRWVLQRYSFGYEHITEEWVDTMMRVVALPKYQRT